MTFWLTLAPNWLLPSSSNDKWLFGGNTKSSKQLEECSKKGENEEKMKKIKSLDDFLAIPSTQEVLFIFFFSFFSFFKEK